MTNQSLQFAHGYALLIGMQYQHWPTGTLKGTLNDINALKSHFVHPEKAAYKKENCVVLQEEEATTQGILQALDTLAEKVQNDADASVIIYYSGHGGKRGEEYFLVPYDFDLRQYNAGTLNKDKTIVSDQFAEKITNIRAGKCLIMLDCCHAENIPVLSKSPGLTTPVFLKGFTQHIETVLESQSVAKSSVPHAQMKKGSGQVIFTSCEAGELSLDVGSNGLFTKVLLECLNGQDNIEQDGWVRLIDLMRYVPKNVSERAKNKYSHAQNPVFKRIENLKTDDFIICAYDIAQAKKINSPAAMTTPPKSGKEELYALIDEGNFVELFARLDEQAIDQKFQYNRFKREYGAGLKGVDLLDFADRLKVFLSQLKQE